MNRRLHRDLEAALDALTESQRRGLLEVALTRREEAATWLTRLLDGLVVQALTDETKRKRREAALIAQLEAERRAEVDAIDLAVNGPLPSAQGHAAMVDPQTGRIVGGPGVG